MKLLVAEKLFDGLQFTFGHVEVLLGVLGILLLHIKPRFGKIEVHALLRRDDIPAQTIA